MEEITAMTETFFKLIKHPNGKNQQAVELIVQGITGRGRAGAPDAHAREHERAHGHDGARANVIGAEPPSVLALSRPTPLCTRFRPM